MIADWFPNAFDQVPAWRPSTASRPHRLTATGTYQFPFGRRRAFLKSGILSRIVGGMQISSTFEYQAGQLKATQNYFYVNPKTQTGTLKQRTPQRVHNWSFSAG